MPELNFGALIPGCFPITGDAFQQVEGKAKWQCNLGFAPEQFSVFLISSTEPLPDNQGLACFLWLSNDSNCESVQFCGFITNDRPSATLRTPTSFLDNHSAVEITLGIALTPLSEIENLEQSVQMERQTRAARVDAIAERIASSFSNFISSHARTEMRVNESEMEGDSMMTSTGERATEEMLVLPLTWMTKWERYIKSRIEKDPTWIFGNNGDS